MSQEYAYIDIQYIHEDLIKGKNPHSYFKITDDYLEGLLIPLMSPQQLENTMRKEAYGQLYFTNYLGNCGQAIYSQIKDHVSCALTVKFAKNIYQSYNSQRMSISAAWKDFYGLGKTKC